MANRLDSLEIQTHARRSGITNLHIFLKGEAPADVNKDFFVCYTSITRVYVQDSGYPIPFLALGARSLYESTIEEGPC